MKFVNGESIPRKVLRDAEFKEALPLLAFQCGEAIAKIHEVDTVVRLTLENSIVITTTPEHPFYVIGKGYVKAADLDFGDECLKVDGSNSFISTKEILEETHKVYNLLDVSGNHNFYANDILVHNKV